MIQMVETGFLPACAKEPRTSQNFVRLRLAFRPNHDSTVGNC